MIDQEDLGSEKIRPLRRAEYDRLVELGAFQGERVELLHGTLVAMSPHGTEHSEAVRRFNRLLSHALFGRAEVQVQLPFAAVDESEPEPDVAVLPLGDYSKEHPSRALLIIEVAFSSLSKDRQIKGPLYAKSGVPEYWLVNLEADFVEVHRSPSGGAYREVMRRGRGQTLSMLEFPDVQLRVDDVLPTR